MVKREIKTKEDIKKNKDTKLQSRLLIMSPRLTEKASQMSNKNIYTFNVDQGANKLSLAKEIKKTYKVNPIKITIINQPRTAIISRGKLGYKSGFKKAQVFLKKGDKLNLV